jgi:hypothetical protein
MGRAQWAVTTSLVSEGERYLNRAWSALSDGYVDETRDALSRAQDLFEEVQKQLFDA